MKLTTFALALIATGVVAAVTLPIFNRIQVNNSRKQNQIQSAKVSQDSVSWQIAAKAFDKNKATAAAIFKGSDKTEALRLFPVNAEKPIGKVTEDVPFFSKHIVNDANFAARLGDIVLDAKSYALPGQSTTQCYIEPAVAFRVWQGKQFTDTVICFKCDQIAVLEHNETAPKRNIGGLLQGRFNVAGDFVVRPHLLALTKEAFPSDGAIESLR